MLFTSITEAVSVYVARALITHCAKLQRVPNCTPFPEAKTQEILVVLLVLEHSARFEKRASPVSA